MARYNGVRLGINPTANVANWILEGTATAAGRIVEVSWGGEVTTTTAMRTRIARDSAVGTGARTAGDVQKTNQLSPANGVFFSTTYATTQPTIIAGALFATSWNAHGGVVRWLASAGEEFVIHYSGAANLSIECRNDNTSTGLSTYALVWDED